MEHNMHYLMWMKSKHLLMNPHLEAASTYSINSSNIRLGITAASSSSWEEQAFAEDAAGPLGGFVWPPRSYSCTFCRREFRSAQALGGHMNVHRRDRARLKQQSLVCNDDQIAPSSPDHHLPLHPHHQPGNDSGRGSSPFSSSPNHDNHNSRASPAELVPQENSSTSVLIRERHSRFPYNSSSSSSSSPDHHHHSNSTLGLLTNISSVNSRNSSPIFGQLSRSNHDHEDVAAVETNLSVGLNSQNVVVDEEEETINSKRVKSSTASFPFYHKPCSTERFPFQQYTSGAIDADIDLELRLGEAPAVK